MGDLVENRVELRFQIIGAGIRCGYRSRLSRFLAVDAQPRTRTSLQEIAQLRPPPQDSPVPLVIAVSEQSAGQVDGDRRRAALLTQENESILHHLKADEQPDRH